MADGLGERARQRCEKEAALLLTPPSLPLSFHPCRMLSVKAGGGEKQAEVKANSSAVGKPEDRDE